jgi:hypothetical protein
MCLFAMATAIIGALRASAYSQARLSTVFS